ncbi:MAG: ribonuclease P protein component [Candidatus Paracaedibacteraceae bacterium]|nr:ribonuclease P protein component [Candidatus Paracaedibacteraceae bacterium]
MHYITLKKRADFVRVSKARNTARSTHIWVQCFIDKSKNNEEIRVGYTASRKTGNAVARNRGKRRMRALARLVLPSILAEFPKFSGDFVLIAIPDTVTCNYTVLANDFKNAVRRCLLRFIAC